MIDFPLAFLVFAIIVITIHIILDKIFPKDKK